jgi:hypothetical protein
LETWLGMDFSIIAIIMFFVVGIYGSKLRDRVDELENELENLKFDIRNSLRSRGFYHHLSCNITCWV